MIDLKLLLIHINKNFYRKYRFKIVKFSNLEIQSPNFDTPKSPILLSLINLNNQSGFLIFIERIIIMKKLDFKYFN
jgi:hypothetical protein